MIDVLIPKGNLDPEEHAQREENGKSQGKHPPHARECLRLPAAGRDAWNGLPLTVLRRNRP